MATVNSIIYDCVQKSNKNMGLIDYMTLADIAKNDSNNITLDDFGNNVALNISDAENNALPTNKEAMLLAKKTKENLEKDATAKKEKEAKETIQKVEKINRDWVKKCIQYGSRIIKLMIENGTPPEKKCNQYHGGTYDNLYCHPVFKFYDIVSDEAVKQIVDYFHSLGYGCEIQRAVTKSFSFSNYCAPVFLNYSINNLTYDLCNKIINATELNSDYGTMYLWFVENENDLNLMKGISW